MATIAEIRSKYPQYEDLSDQQLADKLYTANYSDMPRSQFDKAVGLADSPAPKAAPPATPAKSTGRQWLDSTINAIAGWGQGAAGLIDLPAEAVGKTAGMAVRGLGSDVAKGVGLVSKDVGAKIQHGVDKVANSLDHPTTINDLIERIAPTPTDSTGQTVRALAKGGGAVSTGVGAGRALEAVGRDTVKHVGSTLADKPLAQLIGSLTGGGSAELARQAGAPAIVQVGAGLAGGMVPGVGAAGVKTLETAAGRYTTRGAREAAARALKSAMNTTDGANPTLDAATIDKVASNLETAPVVQASGASPTTAEVAGDAGLSGLQRVLQSITTRGGAGISTRMARNAQLREQATDSALGTGDPAALTSTAAERAQALADQADAGLTRVADPVQPDVAGAQARDIVAQGYGKARTRTNQAYEDPRLAEDLPVDLLPPDPADVLPRAAPTGPDRSLTDFQEEAVKGARAALPPRPQSLTSWVISQGGIHPDSAGVDDLASMGINAQSRPGLFNRATELGMSGAARESGKQPGRTLDVLHQMARAEGFFPSEGADASDYRQLVNALGDEARGTRAVRPTDMPAELEHDAASGNRDFWRQTFDDRDLDPLKMSQQQWRELYDDMHGNTSDQARSLTDMDSVPQAGTIMGPFQRTIQALRDRFYGEGAADAPSHVRAFLNDVMTTGRTSLKTLENWQRRAMDMARDAPDRTQASFLSTIGKAIGARAEQDTPEYRRAAADAARTARTDQAVTFEEGPVGSVTARGDYGRPALPDSQVGGRLIPKGRAGGEAVDQLMKAVGPDQAETIARKELRGALDQVRGDPNGISRVRRDYGEVLRRFPALGDHIDEARDMAALSRSFPRTALGRVGAADRDPATEVARLLTTKDGGKGFAQLIDQTAGNTAAQGGIRRSLAQFVKSNGGATSTVDENLQKVPSNAGLLDGVSTVLERTAGTNVLTPSQRQMLNTYRRELRQEQAARTSNRTPGSDTARNAGAIGGLLKLSLHAATPGAHRAMKALDLILSMATNVGDTRDMLVDAMLDPKKAAELLRTPTPDRLRALAPRLFAMERGALLGTSATTDR